MNRFRTVGIFALLFSISLTMLSGCVGSNTSSAGAPAITTTTIPATATVGVAYAGATISSSGGTDPLSYSIVSGSLPTGMTLTSHNNQGTIGGTPRVTGAFPFTVQVTDSNNPARTAQQAYTITVSDPTPPTVNCPGTMSGNVCQLPAVNLGATVNVTFTATGTGPFRWAESNAPSLLSITASTGVLTGEATQPGANQPFIVGVTDAAGQASTTLNCTITINPGQPLVINPSPTPPSSGVVGTPYGPVQFTVMPETGAPQGGGLSPYFWQLTGNPPPGLTIGQSSGLLSGTPTMAQAAPYTFQVEVGDSQNPQVTAFAPTGSVFSVTITSNIVVAIPAGSQFTSIDADATAVTVIATVSNDINPGGGVTWSIQSGSPLADCSPACGTLVPVGNPPFFSATYTPPNTQPSGANDTPTITATAVDDPSKPPASFMFTINAVGAGPACATGKEAAMSGSFAYLMKGFDANGAVVTAGSVHTDGKGHITDGVEDINRVSSGPQTNLHVVADNSSYTLGADNSGCMTVATAAGKTTFRFSLDTLKSGAPTAGNLIEFDDNAGNGTRGSGIIRAQDASSFSDGKLASSYAFGLSGFGLAGEHVALAGTFTSDGKGNITSGNFDRNDGGTLVANSSSVLGTYNIPAASSTGRGTISASIGGTPFTFAAYMVNSNEAIIAGTDKISASNQIVSGEALASAGPFSNAMLAGSHILRATGLNLSGANPGPHATIGVLAFDGKTAGGVTGTLFDDEGGRISTITVIPGAASYSVDASTGRVTLSGVGANSPVAYIVHNSGSTTAFLMGTDDGAADGVMEFQAAGGVDFKNSTFSKAYSFGTDENVDYMTTNESQSAHFDSAKGTAAGTIASSLPHANWLAANQSFTNTYLFNSDGTGAFGANRAVTNGTIIFFIDEEDENTHPRIMIGTQQ